MTPSDKQRRENERRRLQRQTARRREQAARRRRYSLITSAVGALVVVAVIIVVVATSGGDSSSPAASPTPSTSPSASATQAAYPCTWTTSGTAARRATRPSTTTPPRTGTVTVTVGTNRGTMTFALDRKAAPCAVASFVSLAEQKFFDDTPCPRVTSPGAGAGILQCGDPTGTGRGGPGYRFADELTGKETYTSGVLAMANSGPDTNGSQFFIVYADSPTLQPQYTVVGKVTKGLSVVQKVAAGGNDGSNAAGGGKPTLPITLTKLTVAG